MKKVILILSLLILTSCTNGDVNPFFIKASDGIRVSVNYFPAESERGVILLHMLDRNKEEWNAFIPELLAKRYHVIAIDMRGHGLSDLNWRDFETGEEFGRAVLDVGAAQSYLEKKGVKDIGIIGASIGANIALSYAAQIDDISTIVLLSPGLDYRGVKAVDNMKKYDRPVLFAAAELDVGSSIGTLKLEQEATGEKKLLMYKNADHGTELLKQPNIENEILNWLGQTI